MEDTYWGYELLLDASGMNLEQMTSESNVVKFVDVLLERINMQRIGPTRVEYTAGDILDKAGFTFTQIIVTSSIVGHFVDSTKTAYFNVFSCREFDIEVVKDTVREFFGATKLRTSYLTRHAEGA